MTLGAVWIDHQGGEARQLCFASDSRTTRGPIDGVTKVVLFGRSDVAGVWAGDYRYASLVIAHLDAFLTSIEAMRNRDVDVCRAVPAAVTTVQGHLNASVTPRIPFHQRNVCAQIPEQTWIIAGGYSIRQSAFWLFRMA